MKKLYRLRAKIEQVKRQITIVDVIFIGLVVFFLLAFYFFFKRKVVFITARFKVTDEYVLYAEQDPGNEYASSFMVGDVEKDELGRVVSEIINIESYKTDINDQVMYLDIKLKTAYNPQKNIYTLRGKSIAFGESFTFTFSKVRFKALVVDFPGFRDPNQIKRGKTIVKAQLRQSSREFSDVYGAPNFIAKAIKEGDEVVDSQGNVLVKILETRVIPAQRTVILDSGRPYTVDDPVLKDAFYTIELTTEEVNGKKYMFDYMPVLINQTVPLNLNNISIWPTITEIL